ncbi:endo-1,4-beta-xylanase [Parafilimonas sp.]|uniref:endo-1,4-beta-xylanase n=1 Tax=Parafilimonas sp. TaxID=1969739 RepID=UPI0039E3244B
MKIIVLIAVFIVSYFIAIPKNSAYNFLVAPQDLKSDFSSNVNHPLKKSKKNTLTDNTLREAYKNYFLVGVAINPEIDLKDKMRADLIKKQFSYICAKRALQPYALHPKENVFNWTAGNTLLNFAESNNMKVMGSFLVWYRENHMPDWFYKGGDKTVSKQLLLKRLKDHIDTVLTHYKGKIYTWNVVNEAISNKNGMLFNPADSLYKIAGEDYITKAFEYARAADPNAQLFYNDFMYDQTKSDNMYRLIKKWKEAGVPIDGIGLECHYGIDGINAQLLQQAIDRFSALGLKIQITELDVSIYKRNAKPADILSENFNSNIRKTQAEIYKQLFEIFRKNKGKITGVTLFGADDGQESYLTTKLKKSNYPYIFDQSKQPKEAFESIVNF